MARRAGPDERTSRANIHAAALALFADRGADAVTVRDIAKAARVSPALVLRHFGSKDGLRREIERHVLRVFDDMVAATARPEAPDWGAEGAARSIVDAIARSMPPSSPVPRYLARMLLDGSPAGRRLFRNLFALSRRMLDALVAAGRAAPGRDPDVRAAFLMANDLAVMLLRAPIGEALGIDPLSEGGMLRWAAELLDVYTHGIAPRRRRRIRRPRPGLARSGRG